MATRTRSDARPRATQRSLRRIWTALVGLLAASLPVFIPCLSPPLAWAAPAADAALLEQALANPDPGAAVAAGLKLAAQYVDKKETGCAEAALRETFRRYPETRPSEVLFELGYLLFRSYERRPEALSWLRRAVAAGKPPAKAAQAQLFVSYVYGEMGDQQQAEAEFARLRKLYPGDRGRIAQGAMDSIFFRHWTSTDPEGLLREARDVRREFADLPDIAGALDLVAGRLAMSLGRPAEALPLFEQVPANLDFPAARKADALVESLLCRLQMGDREKAQAGLVTLIRQYGTALRPNQATALGELIARSAPGGARAVLRVTVTEEGSGRPVPNALVRASAGGGTVSLRRYTDAQGTALLTPLPPGDASVVLYLGRDYITASRAVALAAGEDATPMQWAIPRLPGRQPRLRLLLLTPEGKPAADADVQAWGLSTPIIHADEAGAVSVSDLWRVPGNEERYLAVRVLGVGVAVVKPPEIRDGVSVRLQPGASIEGRATVGPDRRPAFGTLVSAVAPGLAFRAVT